ncbi:MAG TPA: hypothetical protein VFZ34_06060 [Blastocatellia bacterium]|nr:hypothetical protein [Blastocatellia bacterium]
MTKNYYRANLYVSIRSARIAFFLSFLTFLSFSSLANSRSVNLAEMTSHAGRIVHGRVVEVREGVHPLHGQIAVTFLKVQVIEMLKGGAAREVTFMQYGNSTNQYVAHQPKYRVGEEVVLFLYPESKLGFTSPVGQGQGKFVVREDARSGQRILQNEHLNRALFDRLDATKVNARLALNATEREAVAQPEGRTGAGIDVNAFRSLVRKFAANPKANLQ